MSEHQYCEGAQVQALLLRRFRGSDAGTTGRSGSIRTSTGLRAAAEARVAERKKARQQRRRDEQAREAAGAAAHAGRLGVALLRDLRALAGRRGEESASARRVLDLRARFPGRPGLQDRLGMAGLPGR